jgi:phosphonate transport system substrate-binding protein
VLTCAVSTLMAGVALVAMAQPVGAPADLVFSVTEGVTYQATPKEIREKFEPLAEVIGKALHRNVNVVLVPAYNDVRAGLSRQEYDLAFIHPAHLSVLAIRDSGYKLLAVTKGYQNYTASFLVRPDAPYKTLADLKGLSLGAPDEDSITAWMVRATLRDALGDSKQVKLVYTRYQDAVPFFVDKGLTHAGATAANAVVKAWSAQGGKILAKSKPVPIKHMLAGSSLSADQVQKVREYLLGLDTTEEGKKKLEPTKYEGFAPYAEADMLAIGKWLGLPPGAAVAAKP